MTEPDFEQIAQTFMEEHGIGRLDEWDDETSARIVVGLVEALRQVWNARGTVDAQVVAEDHDYVDAIKALDR